MSLIELLLLGICFVLLAVAVFSIYPGELSWFSGRLHARLYDASAASYEKKWQRHNYEPYDRMVRDAAEQLLQVETPAVVDLCSGTGRALFVAIKELGEHGSYTAVDRSVEMLFRAQERAGNLDAATSSRINTVVADIDTWLRSSRPCSFDLITLMEASEFISGFIEICPRITDCLKPNGLFVLTYPTPFYAVFFPGRGQRRGQLHRLLVASGMTIKKDMSWRSRYRLCVAAKA